MDDQQIKSRPDSEWHLDKRVNIALILTLGIQIITAIWWASAMNERMHVVERRLEVMQQRATQTEESLAAQARDLAVLASELRNTNRQLERLYAQGEATNEILRRLLGPQNGFSNGRNGN